MNSEPRQVDAAVMLEQLQVILKTIPLVTANERA